MISLYIIAGLSAAGFVALVLCPTASRLARLEEKRQRKALAHDIVVDWNRGSR